ncbi:hypothetical protein [Mycoplasmopsis verecunda]|uniref:Uncharacterized protein n=1 Tax=Mycoplasmopsis verecunda TaxID=171291 RepID=A0A1T4KJ80_9BACT|nr:hypothetical protein [Mycoplasmopsis verecunda]WPB54245.1 hypothetical protein SAM46_02035 [Mycoplasmopsis verecunda]SJZ42492.1 hypothetical protein SAMN02745154_00065 [Mycoplasmopsis verecunda]
MISIAVIWAVGLLPLILFLVIVLSQSSFINHVKMIRLHLHNNEKIFQKVILNSYMMKYWKLRYWIFTALTILLVVITTAYIPIAILFVYQTFKFVNEDIDNIGKVVNTGIPLVLLILSCFFSGVVVWTIFREIYAWNKDMQGWELVENENQVSYHQYLLNNVSKREFPAKIKLHKIQINNRQTTLAYRTSDLMKLSSSKRSLWYKEGKILFDTFVDYNQVVIQDKIIDETDFVSKLLSLVKLLDKDFETKTR